MAESAVKDTKPKPKPKPKSKPELEPEPEPEPEFCKNFNLIGLSGDRSVLFSSNAGSGQGQCRCFLSAVG